MISQDFINKTKEIVDGFDKEYLKAVVITGSATYPFIENPHDLDIVAFTSNKAPEHPIRYVHEIRKELRSAFGENVSVISRTYESLKQGDYLKAADSSLVRKTYLSKMLLDTNIMIKGSLDMILPEGQFDIIGKDKDEFMVSANLLIHSTPMRRAIEKYGHTKMIYQTLAGIYFIENGKYELTEEQKKNVNIAHDCSEGWEELYEYAKNWLEKNS